MDPSEIARRAQDGAQRFIGVIRQMHGIELGFDRDSVARLSAHISEHRLRWQREFDRDLLEGMSEMMGCYLGECLVHVYRGRWVYFDTPAVAIDGIDGEQHHAFPFNKVAKHFANGDSDAVIAFFDAVPLLSSKNLTK